MKLSLKAVVNRFRLVSMKCVTAIEFTCHNNWWIVKYIIVTVRIDLVENNLKCDMDNNLLECNGFRPSITKYNVVICLNQWLISRRWWLWIGYHAEYMIISCQHCKTTLDEGARNKDDSSEMHQDNAKDLEVIATIAEWKFVWAFSHKFTYRNNDSIEPVCVWDSFYMCCIALCSVINILEWFWSF